MKKKRKRVLTRILAWMIPFLIFTEVTYVNSVMVLAAGGENEVVSDSLIQGPTWVDGSSATAGWEAYEGANYYEVEIRIYHNNDYVGKTTTGTADTQIDVQQEIYDVIGRDSGFAAVYVTVTVTAEYMDEKGVVTKLVESTESDKIDYLLKEKKNTELPNHTFDLATYTISWDENEVVDRFDSRLFFLTRDGKTDCIDDFVSLDKTVLNGKRRSYQLSEESQNYIKQNVYEVDESYMYLRYIIYPKSEFASEYTYFYAYSEDILHVPAVKKKPLKPENIHIEDETFTLSWDYNQGIKGFELMLSYADKGGENQAAIREYIPIEDASVIENRSCYSLPDRILSQIRSEIYELEDTFIVIELTVYPKTDYEDEYTCYNEIIGNFDYPRDNNRKVLELQNVVFDEKNCSIIWDEDEIVGDIDFEFHFNTKNGGSGTCNLDNLNYDDFELRGNKRIFKIPVNILKSAYNNSDDMKVNVKTTVYPKEQYAMDYAVLQQNWGCFVLDRNMLFVQNISISPRNPVLYIGHSYYLGKIIEPKEAYYDMIEWTSEAPACVTVDESGKITGIAVGHADITATIDDAKDNVNVTVYDIHSNIENEEDNQLVTDTAGDIIDDLVNDNEFSSENNDIDPSVIEEIRDEIQEAIIRGDEISTDLNEEEKSQDDIGNDWNKITETLSDENIEFVGAYDIEIEMHYNDDEGKDHHIGNITELEGEVEFTLPLPEGIKEAENMDDCKLVRVHDGTVEVMNVTINNDETFTTQSDKYSEFVWVKKATKGDVTKVFTDIPTGEWYLGAAQFVYDNGIMNGVSGTAFGPKGVLTREQFITVLYNMEGAPDIAFKQIFDDVKDEPSVWYAKSVTWAAENNITSGIGNNLFGTGKEITREQLATLLYNYAQQKDEFKLTINDNAVADFPDADQISDWATTGMKWAVTNGVMGGKTGKDGKNILDPQGKASRAECAQMIKNLKEKAVK